MVTGKKTCLGGYSGTHGLTSFDLHSKQKVSRT